MVASFGAPAFVNDLGAGPLAQWSAKVHGWFREAEQGLPVNGRLYNMIDRPADDAAHALIPWNGFPRKFALRWPTDVERRWRTAETVVDADMDGRSAAFFRRQGGGFVNARLPFRDQDEYCEWHTFRDPASGAIERIVFTSENPEYWQHLAETDEDRLLQLYRQLVSSNVARDDLFFNEDVFRPEVRNGQTLAVNQNGRYNPLNRWNTHAGIVHLTHPANSLGAEVALAADATILRRGAGGDLVTDDGNLICCAAYGGVNRSSDPTIGGRINELVRGGNAVTINDPIGLYIGDIDFQPIEPPGGIAAADCWRVVRGNAADKMILRAQFALPEGSGFALEDVLVGGEPLRFGAQLAELVTIVIHGRAIAVAGQAPTEECIRKCCRRSDIPTLQRIAELDEACPEPSPIAEAPGDDNFVLTANASAAATALAEEDLPNSNSRV